jgi:hypothetical protein
MKNTNENKLAKYETIGATLAKAYHDSDIKAGETKQELLLASAKAHAGKQDIIKAILTGYADKFASLGYSDGIVRARKSEANQVFKAVGLTEISNDNLKALTEFKGGYNDFIAMARSLIQAKETKGETERKVSNRQPKVTENQEQFIHDKMQSATIYQLTDFIETGIKELNKPHDKETASLAERNQLALIMNICKHMIKSDTTDKMVKECANTVIETIKPVLGKLDIIATETQKALSTPYDNKEAVNS